MLISFVSCYRQKGKSRAATILMQAGLGWKVKLTSSLKDAADLFCSTEMKLRKHEKSPRYGVSKIDITNAIAEAISSLHPELPVAMAKEVIEQNVRLGIHVFIPDTRRQREFQWLDALAKRYGITHHVVEIVPADTEGAMLDTWTNGLEKCGHEAWPEDGIRIVNDGTDAFDKAVLSVFNILAKTDEDSIKKVVDTPPVT